MRSWWSAVALVVLLLVGAGVAQTGEGHVLLQDAGLVQGPSSYTELAFTTPGSLPSQLTSSHAPINVLFGIHDSSGSSRIYQWSIVLVRSGRSDVEASGTVSTSVQGTATVAKTVTAACVGGRLQVVVRLVSPAESIAFWVTCPSPSRGKQ
jgi:hypothetical protein